MKPENLLDAVNYFIELGMRFITISGIDELESFELLYHFSEDKTGVVFSLRVILDIANSEILSMERVLPAVAWIENEISELFGIRFRELSGKEHVLLSKDYCGRRNPLRKI
ncbi:MAG: NADH-quinone oxidoreductase subunit C [Elusimicrobia bacterium]|nr:NADH-quinone oxidoreductase subunit C [Elusimicrobiota bacterium]